MGSRRTGSDVRRRRAGRRGLLAVLVGCLLVLTGCATTHVPLGSAGSPRRPNIVFVLTDDLSSDLLPYLPHVVALANQGTSFSQFYVAASGGDASRRAILTGRYPHGGGGTARDSYAVTLQRAGYRTAMMGNYLDGYQPTDTVPPGWDEWDVGGNDREYGYTVNQDGVQVSYGHDPDDYLTDVLAQRAGNFIDTASRSTRPFALEVATFAPHSPATPSPAYRASFSTAAAPRGPTWDTTPTGAPAWLAHRSPLSRRDVAAIDRNYRARLESAQSIDDLVGYLERRLRVDHELDDTYVVFSSSSGFHDGQYRLPPGAGTAFDTDTRVPLVVAGPGVPQARTVDSMVSSIDLAPTFAQLAGAASADRDDGVSITGLLHGQAAPSGWQQAVRIEHRGPGRASRQGDPPSYEAIRTAGALYVEYADGAREYYDTRTDPDELHNLASSAPIAVLDPLRQQLQALEVCRGVRQCQAAAR